MSILPQYVRHTVGADLDYGFDLSDWLDTGETVSSVNWTILDGASGVTKHGGDKSTDGLSILVWLVGVTANDESEPYVVEGVFVTSAGRTDVARLHVHVTA